jgi:hypothetical protein
VTADADVGAIDPCLKDLEVHEDSDCRVGALLFDGAEILGGDAPGDGSGGQNSNSVTGSPAVLIELRYPAARLFQLPIELSQLCFQSGVASASKARS